MLSDHDLLNAQRNLHLFDPEQKARLLSLLEQRDRHKKLQEARDHFLPFVRKVWPDVILGAHHTLIADAFEELVFGSLNRLVINIGFNASDSAIVTIDSPDQGAKGIPTSKVTYRNDSLIVEGDFE